MGDFSVSPSEFNTGLLLLDVYQPGLSWSIQEEVDPVQWTVIVGNIGGAWGKTIRNQLGEHFFA